MKNQKQKVKKSSLLVICLQLKVETLKNLKKRIIFLKNPNLYKIKDPKLKNNK